MIFDYLNGNFVFLILALLVLVVYAINRFRSKRRPKR